MSTIIQESNIIMASENKQFAAIHVLNIENITAVCLLCQETATNLRITYIVLTENLNPATCAGRKLHTALYSLMQLFLSLMELHPMSSSPSCALLTLFLCASTHRTGCTDGVGRRPRQVDTTELISEIYCVQIR